MRESFSQPSSSLESRPDPPLLGWRSSATRRCHDGYFGDASSSLPPAQWPRLEPVSLSSTLSNATGSKSFDRSDDNPPSNSANPSLCNSQNPVQNMRKSASEFAAGERQQRMLQKIDDLAQCVAQIQSDVAENRRETFAKLSDLTAGVNELRDDMNRVRKFQPIDESTLRRNIKDFSDFMLSSLGKFVDNSQQPVLSSMADVSSRLDLIANHVGTQHGKKQDAHEAQLHYPSIKDNFWDMQVTHPPFQSPTRHPSTRAITSCNAGLVNNSIGGDPAAVCGTIVNYEREYSTTSYPTMKREMPMFPAIGSFHTTNEDLFSDAIEHGTAPNAHELAPSGGCTDTENRCDIDDRTAPWEVPVNGSDRAYESRAVANVHAGTTEPDNSVYLLNRSKSEFSRSETTKERNESSRIRKRISKRRRPV